MTQRRTDNLAEAQTRVEACPSETLSAYLDDELSADERKVVDARLERSASWSAKLDELQDVDVWLRSAAMGLESDELATILCSEESNDDRETPAKAIPAVGSSAAAPGPSRMPWGFIAAAAAVLVAGTFLAATLVDGPADNASAVLASAPTVADYDELIEAMVEDHQNFSRMAQPYELESSDSDEVAEYLLASTGVTETPAWTPMALTGASRCSTMQTPAGVTFLEDDAGLISVFAVERSRVGGDVPMSQPGLPGDCCSITDNTSLCVWTSGDWLFVSIANRNETALEQSLLAAVEPEGLMMTPDHGWMSTADPRW